MSISAFTPTSLPRRIPPLDVKTSRASACSSRSATASGPKPEKMGIATTPIFRHANMANTVSGSMGMKMPALSPGRIPIPRMAFARRQTCAFISA